MAIAAARLIVIEGIDGAGTTTQTRCLAARLQQDGYRVVTTCQPSTGPVGALIRQALERRLMHNGTAAPIELAWTTLALLFAADRADHVQRCIEPALSSGAVVICDRYDLSSYIYQSLTSADSDQALSWIRQLNARVRRPDLTLVIDIDPALAESRRKNRGTEPELFEQRSLQQRLAVAYEQSQVYVPNDRLVHIDGAASMAKVTEQIYSVCRALD